MHRHDRPPNLSPPRSCRRSSPRRRHRAGAAACASCSPSSSCCSCSSYLSRKCTTDASSGSSLRAGLSLLPPAPSLAIGPPARPAGTRPRAPARTALRSAHRAALCAPRCALLLAALQPPALTRLTVHCAGITSSSGRPCSRPPAAASCSGAGRRRRRISPRSSSPPRCRAAT